MELKHTYLSAILLLLVLSMSCSESEQQSTPEVDTSPTSQPLAIDTTGADLSRLNSLHERVNFKPRDRSLVEYVNSRPNRPEPGKDVIYLMPLGDMSAEIEALLQAEVEYLKIFFQLEVKIADRVPFNDLKTIEKVKTRLVNRGHSHGKGKESTADLREQIDASSLIEHYILPNKPADAAVVLGITDHDIYSAKYNFLYGLSNIEGGTGLISTHRLKKDPMETKLNIRKLASKQIVNLFSLKNEKDFVSLLTFSNNMRELKAKTPYLSPRSLEKLKVNIGFDYNPRFQALRKFWTSEGNTEMAAFYTDCLVTESAEAAVESTEEAE